MVEISPSFIFGERFGADMEAETAEAITNVNKKRKRLIILSSIALALAAIIFWAFYDGLVVRTYEITTDKAPEAAGVRIVVIADLHSHIYGENQQDLLDVIKAQKPDIIALVGDIVDDHDPQAGAKLLLQDIIRIAPAYYVSGNHEYWSGECESIKQLVSRYGITVLSNERRNVTVNGVKLCICGIDDPEVFKYTGDERLLALPDEDDILKRFSDLDDDAFNILLAHRPERIDAYRQYDFDLVLSGHAHGGQVRIPLFVNGIFAPDQGFFPEYAGGLYPFGEMKMIVSRGLGYNARVPRVFNPPELVIVDIKGESKD